MLLILSGEEKVVDPFKNDSSLIKINYFIKL